MKAYVFVNKAYFNDKQCGIQTTHALVDMAMAVRQRPSDNMLFSQWAIDHKTLVMLNGGNDESLRRRGAILAKIAPSLGFPFSVFQEDKASVNEATTAVVAVVPSAYCFNLSPAARQNRQQKLIAGNYESSLDAAEDETFSPLERLDFLLDAPLA